MRIFLVLIFFCSFPAIALEQGNKNELNKAEQSKPNANIDKNSAHPPINITVSPTITTTSKPSRETEYKDNSSGWEAITSISTFALAVITFGLAYFTLKLWRATGALVMGADETAKKELRAYIAIKEIFIRRLDVESADPMYQAVVRFENSGRTSAKQWRWSLDVGVGDSDMLPDRGFTIPQLTAPMPLAPNAQWESRQVFWKDHGNEISPEDARRMTTKRFAFVWGRAEYLDIFDKPQWVDFRFVTREVRSDGRGIAGWALQPTAEGNDAS